MANIRIIFRECIQDSQEYGSDDEHMVSRVFFTLEVDGQSHAGLYCDVKQTVGTDYDSAPLEVSSPKGASYKGPFDHQAFRKATEDYYREAIGSSGSAIRFGPGAKNIRMRHNRIIREKTVEFDASGLAAAW